jgi:hypothetical protein
LNFLPWLWSWFLRRQYWRKIVHFCPLAGPDPGVFSTVEAWLLRFFATGP